MNITCGIVLYNPDIDRLIVNIEAIEKQISHIILVDNGSNNIEAVKKIINGNSKILLIENFENKGIAKALNQIVEKSIECFSADWVLTLDQDSVCQPELIDNYKRFLDLEKAGMLTCHIEDRNFKFEEEKKNVNNVELVDFCITSGSLINTVAWDSVGSFDENMFIDKVDTDMCWSLIENGWRIYQISYVGILHEIGNNTSRKNFFGRTPVIFNHSSFRLYYIVRNGIYCARKHPQNKNAFGMYRSSYRRILLCLVYEKDKFAKLKAGIKGIIDGHRIPISVRSTR